MLVPQAVTSDKARNYWKANYLAKLNDESIVLNLFDDVTFLAAQDQVEAGEDGSLIWVGHLDGVPQSQVILVQRDGSLSGTIKWSDNIYAVRPIGDGRHAIDHIDVLISLHRQPLRDWQQADRILFQKPDPLAQ